MDDTKLKSYIAVIDTGSLTQAAEKLSISPVSIKRQMDSLENELNTTLLLRTNSGCEPTEAGKIYYDFAKKTIDLFQETKREISALSTTRDNIIIICSGQTYATAPLDLFCVGYQEKHPDVTTLYLPSHHESWVHHVRSGKADCAVVTKSYYDNINDGSFSYIPLYNRKVMGILNQKHHLASYKHLSLEDLKQETLHITYASFPQLSEDLQQHHIRTADFSNPPSSSEVFNVCATGGIFVTLDPIDLQYRPLISIPIDYPAIECGWITQKKISPLLANYIETSKQIALENNLMS